MASAKEAESCSLFVYAQYAVSIRTTFIEMNNLQPPTLIKMYSSTAMEIFNETLKQNMSKAIVMKFYWIGYIIKQGRFIIYWKPGKHNLVN